METIKGDLLQLALDGVFDTIVHGCNCFCCMNAGIAYQIKNTFPEAYIADKNTKFGDKSKLGTLSYAVSRDILIVNAYTQYDTGLFNIQLDYEALRSCMRIIGADGHFRGRKIGMPYIGCGLAGGDWSKVKPILEEELINRNVTIVEYNNVRRFS
jgi:O-acetyl-ADP-ribose deacetylase (regulator of RNase III)